MTTIGIDVSKAKIDCLWLKDAVTHKRKTKVFKNTPEEHQALLDWAIEHTQASIQDIQFVMEATGIYHEHLAYCLHEAGAQVSVVNPAHVRSYAESLGSRNKTDKKDSFILALYGATQHPRRWVPEPAEVRQLKALIARYEALEKDIQREKNRLEKAQIGVLHEVVMTSIQTMIDQLEQEKARIDQLISQHIDQNPTFKQDKQYLESIPGIGPIISRYMIMVIRSRPFDSAKQCSAYLGLNPVAYESGSSVRRRSRLSKAGNAMIRAKLYMAAVVAIRYNPDIKQQYERLVRRGKSKMLALGAAMRKLVQICFGVVKHQNQYQPQRSIAC
jgi:transposase